MCRDTRYIPLWCVVFFALLFTSCLSKTSPGCPGGMIWDGAACRHPVGFPRCGSGEHADTIVTYILQAETVTVISLDSYEGYDGAFIELQIPKLALPGMVPYLTNVVSQGMLLRQELGSPHYHHVSLCNDIILDYSIDYASNLIWGGGMTAFIKRGSSEGDQGGLLIGDGGDGGP